jgi:hypothetical protein
MHTHTFTHSFIWALSPVVLLVSSVGDTSLVCQAENWTGGRLTEHLFFPDLISFRCSALTAGKSLEKIRWDFLNFRFYSGLYKSLLAVATSIADLFPFNKISPKFSSDCLYIWEALLRTVQKATGTCSVDRLARKYLHTVFYSLVYKNLKLLDLADGDLRPLFLPKRAENLCRLSLYLLGSTARCTKSCRTRRWLSPYWTSSPTKRAENLFFSDCRFIY